MADLSLAQARRVALAAQGFTDPPPRGAVDVRHMRRVLARIHLLQIDSVTVLVRSHYLPLYSRLGPYDRDLLTRTAYGRRELFETWAHEACFVRTALHPLMRRRMAAVRPGERVRRLLTDDPGYVARVRDEVAGRGPLAVGDLADAGASTGPWWGWSKGKTALEWLFATGALSVARRRNFARVYDLTERVIPADVLAAPTPDAEQTRRELLLLAARALGIATAGDLADYFRLHRPAARQALDGLAADGLLTPVTVEGWAQPAYLHPGAPLPRRVRRSALLSPFDPVVWERARTERLFGFRYRIEIYVPADRRTFGYYVLPFLHDERLVGRVDLKADRAGDRMLVRAAWHEPAEDPATVAAALAPELRRLATWLGLSDVHAEPRGDLTPALVAAVSTT